MQKTLGMKVLEGHKVSYETLTYPSHERDAAIVAQYLKVPANQVFKTLVVPRPPAKTLLVLIPANHRLDLKKLAKVTGDKKLKMATHTDAEALTGLQVGGISPLALLNKGFTVIVDTAVQAHEKVYVSAGEKGINLGVVVRDLLRIINARVADVSNLAE